MVYNWSTNEKFIIVVDVFFHMNTSFLQAPVAAGVIFKKFYKKALTVVSKYDI